MWPFSKKKRFRDVVVGLQQRVDLPMPHYAFISPISLQVFKEIDSFPGSIPVIPKPDCHEAPRNDPIGFVVVGSVDEPKLAFILWPDPAQGASVLFEDGACGVAEELHESLSTIISAPYGEFAITPFGDRDWDAALAALDRRAMPYQSIKVGPHSYLHGLSIQRGGRKDDLIQVLAATEFDGTLVDRAGEPVWWHLS